jgi:hypothetical protein
MIRPDPDPLTVDDAYQRGYDAGYADAWGLRTVPLMPIVVAFVAGLVVGIIGTALVWL